VKRHEQHTNVATKAQAKTPTLQLRVNSLQASGAGLLACQFIFFSNPLILFTESLGIRFAVRVEKFLTALLPRRFEFGLCDVPVRPAFPGNGTQVPTKIFQRGPAMLVDSPKNGDVRTPCGGERFTILKILRASTVAVRLYFLRPCTFPAAAR
jgi:hypothetical protein